MESLLIGWAEESLVPNKKVTLAGQFYERIAEYVESEITATAMALESGNEKAIIISCDITSFNNDLINLIRDKFSKLTTEISPEQVEGFVAPIYYDLQGRRVLNPTNGVYIVNGKKVVVK